MIWRSKCHSSNNNNNCLCCGWCLTEDMIFQRDHLRSLVMLVKVLLVRNVSTTAMNRCSLHNNTSGDQNLDQNVSKTAANRRSCSLHTDTFDVRSDNGVCRRRRKTEMFCPPPPAPIPSRKEIKLHVETTLEKSPTTSLTPIDWESYDMVDCSFRGATSREVVAWNITVLSTNLFFYFSHILHH